MAIQTSPEKHSATLYSHVHDAVLLDIKSSKTLLNLLQQEQDAIQNRRRELLTDIITRKTECLQTIDSNTAARYKLLTERGLAADEAGWKEFVESFQQKKLQQDWQALLSILKQCKHANEVNGRLVNRSQQTLHNLLDILRGKLNTPAVYTQRGTTESVQSGQRFTKV